MYQVELKHPIIPLKDRTKELFPGYDTIHLSIYCNQVPEGRIEPPYGVSINLIPHNGNGLRLKACDIPNLPQCDTLEDLLDAARDLGKHAGKINRVLRYSYEKGMCKDNPN